MENKINSFTEEDVKSLMEYFQKNKIGNELEILWFVAIIFMILMFEGWGDNNEERKE